MLERAHAEFRKAYGGVEKGTCGLRKGYTRTNGKCTWGREGQTRTEKGILGKTLTLLERARVELRKTYIWHMGMLKRVQ